MAPADTVTLDEGVGVARGLGEGAAETVTETEGVEDTVALVDAIDDGVAVGCAVGVFAGVIVTNEMLEGLPEGVRDRDALAVEKGSGEPERVCVAVAVTVATGPTAQ